MPIHCCVARHGSLGLRLTEASPINSLFNSLGGLDVSMAGSWDVKVT